MKALPGWLPNENETRNGNVVLWEIPFHELLPSAREGSTKGRNSMVGGENRIDRQTFLEGSVSRKLYTYQYFYWQRI
jgi:hypothetical protein